MASELARQILDAGFPAAKPVRDHDLFGIPTLEELTATEALAKLWLALHAVQ